ncbi:MAG TPA: hypothetical protein VK177_19960 [Flavobacteriales bacterium]|nr:hypothetical protein [Flavobacteriales bacterium]
MRNLCILFFFLSVNSFGQKWLWTNNTINPNAKYSHQLSDTVDADGNIYISGDFDSTVLDLGSVLLKNPNGGRYSSAFLAKFDKHKNLVWAHAAGGNSYDGARYICFDKQKNVYVAGYFRSDVTHVESVALNNSHPGTNTEDAFIAKYNAAGGFEWACSGGGKGIDLGCKISFDKNENVILKGTALSPSIRFNDKVLVKYDTASSWESMNFAVTFDQNGNLLALSEYDAIYKKLKNDIENEFMKLLKEFKVKISCSGCTGIAYEVKIKSHINSFGVEIKVKKECDETKGQKIRERLEAFILKQNNLLMKLEEKETTFNVSRVLKC